MENIDLREMGKRIQMCRKMMGYTQENLADEMNVSVQMVSNLERGNKAIRIDNLIRLSEILHVSTDFLLKGPEDTEEVHMSGIPSHMQKDMQDDMLQRMEIYKEMINKMRSDK